MPDLRLASVTGLFIAVWLTWQMYRRSGGRVTMPGLSTRASGARTRFGPVVASVVSRPSGRRPGRHRRNDGDQPEVHRLTVFPRGSRAVRRHGRRRVDRRVATMATPGAGAATRARSYRRRCGDVMFGHRPPRRADTEPAVGCAIRATLARATPGRRLPCRAYPMPRRV